MWNHIMTNIFEISLIFVLGSNLGIRGVALGFGLGILMLTVLNFYAVAGSIGFYFDFRMVIKAGIGGVVMTVTGLAAHRFLEQHVQLGATAALLGAILVSLLVYAITLQATRALRSRPKAPTIPVS
ncbi:hypothetical protein BGX30_014673 [Mortierella sp. GBA39]|nr:hypothetical protein BGX30_014673 [Mortierella sp. GBA39]